MRKSILATAITVAALPLAGCNASDVLIQQFEVGQCVSFDAVLTEDATEVGDLPILDCNEAHDGEVSFVHTLEGDEYPTDVIETAEEACLDTFEDYVGAPYETSSLDISYLYPSEETWGIGDREIVCIVVPISGQLTEPIAGSGL